MSGEGRFWCNVFREAMSVGCVLIGRYLIELGVRGADEVRLPIALTPQGHGHGGRIFVDLEALAAATLTGLAWTTTQKPLREVAIGVGVCTFNREPFVVRTLQRLLAAPPEAAVARIAVVNQGARLESDAFAALARQGGGRLASFEQGNFGGAGGFTRSVIELLRHAEVTHVLFMDDDVELDARHLLTTAAFLRYARKPLVVGGHMLDLFRRNVLYEAGNAVSPDNQLRPNHHNLDLNKLESLTALSRAAPSHFNGWWYAAIPVRCFHEHGLPLPVSSAATTWSTARGCIAPASSDGLNPDASGRENVGLLGRYLGRDRGEIAAALTRLWSSAGWAASSTCRSRPIRRAWWRGWPSRSAPTGATRSC